MRPSRPAEDLVPVSEFKARAATWLRHAANTGAPVVVTLHGKRAGVLLSPEAVDALTEQARFVSAVSDGLAQAAAARLHTDAKAHRRMRARFGAT